MTTEQLRNQLEATDHSSDPLGDRIALLDHLQDGEENLEFVSCILLRFMEANPEEDFGSPDAQVHFVESFYRKGYEEKLLESLQRCPTPHTVWMLERLVNGSRTPEERSHLTAVLATVEKISL